MLGMLFVWLASVLDPSCDFVEETYQTYKNLTPLGGSYKKETLFSTNVSAPSSPLSRNLVGYQSEASERQLPPVTLTPANEGAPEQSPIFMEIKQHFQSYAGHTELARESYNAFDPTQVSTPIINSIFQSNVPK